MPYKEGRSDDWHGASWCSESCGLVGTTVRPSSDTSLWADVATNFVKEFRIVLIVKVRERYQFIGEKILGNGWDQGFKYV